MWLRSVVLVLIVACSAGTGATPPAFGANTPADLRTLASDTFALFAAAVPRWERCLDGVVLSGAWELEDRGLYEPDSGEITIRIPATAAQLEISIVHELAHHLEFACPQSDEIRAAFISAQAIDHESGWFEGPTWEAIPSEQWASAVVLHVLGKPDQRARTLITPEALAIVQAWATDP